MCDARVQVHDDFAQFKQSMAAMPPTVLPGTATMLAGLQQTPQQHCMSTRVSLFYNDFLSDA